MDEQIVPTSIPRLASWLAPPLLAVTAACGGGGDQGSQQDGPDAGPAAGQEAPTPAVEVVEAQEGTLPLRERLTGTVRAAGQVIVSPQASGTIVEIMARNGERVEEGDALVRIRSETERAQVGQARANLQDARAQAKSAKAELASLRAQFKRTRALARDSLVSQETLETQRAQLEAARASYQQAQAQVEAARATVEQQEEALDQMTVRAPIDGRLGQRNAEVGMRVSPQTALFTMGRLENMQVEVPVPQDLLVDIEAGQPVEVRSESLQDTVVEASISRISPFLESGSFSGQVEIDVSNHAGLFLPGMFVTVDVLHGSTETTTLVPRSALFARPGSGERGLYVVDLGDTQLRLAEGDSVGSLTSPVETRFRTAELTAEGSQVVGLENVDPGTWVVVIGQHLLEDQGTGGVASARIRPVGWERIVDLQQLQRQDFVQQFLEKQQRLARAWRDSVRQDTSTTDEESSL